MNNEILLCEQGNWRMTLENCTRMIDVIAFAASYQADDPLSEGGCS